MSFVNDITTAFNIMAVCAILIAVGTMISAVTGVIMFRRLSRRRRLLNRLDRITGVKPH